MRDWMLYYIPCPSIEIAEKIGRVLVDEKLAACANIIPQMISIYRWQGEVQREAEVLLLVKSSHGLQKLLTDKVKALHPYEVPCVTGFPFESLNTDYTRWMTESLIQRQSNNS